MSWKSTAVIGASVIVMAVGVNQALEPRTLKEIEKQNLQQQLDNLSDSNERNRDLIRDKGQDGLNWGSGLVMTGVQVVCVPSSDILIGDCG